MWSQRKNCQALNFRAIAFNFQPKKSCKLICALLLCLLFASPIHSQVDSLDQRLIHATMEFRDHFLVKSSDFKEIQALLDRWKSLEANDPIRNYLTANIVYGIQMYNVDLKRIKKLTRKQLKKRDLESALTEGLTQNDIDVIKENQELFSFMHMDYIESKFPFKVSLDLPYRDEVNFVDIQPEETVADIGSGSGDHILLLALFYPQNDFILTEVNYAITRFLEIKLKENEDLFFRQDRNIEVVRGEKDDVNLGKRVDKIIIRNTFHHFSKKEKMLNSIANSLNDGGSVIFIEPIESPKRYMGYCSKRIPYDEVMAYIKASPLEIVEEKVEDYTLYLRCVLKNQVP